MFSWNLLPTTLTPAARFRLIAVDLDSLVLHNGSLDPSTAGLVRAAHGTGVKVVLVSTRGPEWLRRYWARLGLGTPAITYDGALVYDFPSRMPLLSRPIDPPALERALETISRVAPKSAIVLEGAEFWTMNRVGSYARSIVRGQHIWPQDAGHQAAGRRHPIFRLTVDTPPGDLDLLAPALVGDGVSVARIGDPDALQLRSAAASREQALVELAGLLEVSLDETVVITGNSGDGKAISSSAALQALLSNTTAGVMEGSDPVFLPDIDDDIALPASQGSDNDLWPTIER